jgi:hypothetical protein
MNKHKYEAVDYQFEILRHVNNALAQLILACDVMVESGVTTDATIDIPIEQIREKLHGLQDLH